MMDREAKQRELERLRSEIERLESELAIEGAARHWPPHGYYLVYHVLAGFSLGMFGATTSLLFNIVGSILVGQEPLRLIRVYLTFPLGASVLQQQSNDNLLLAIGCCLYLGTGMVLGVPFQLVLTRWLGGSSFTTRFLIISGLSLLLWLFNFYAVLWWLQPLLFGGNWIVQQIPGWVGALTHLVFGWTMLLVQPLGRYTPYEQGAEAT